MSDGSELLLAKLDSLHHSLDDLEENLEPLLAQTLPESLLPLETIQQVKLNVALPYLVYDLIFIYLKTRGVDPKTHPVIAELDRVRQYFDKIKNAEDPEKRKTTVDKAAANRFIKHAIAQVRAQRPPGDDGPSHIRFSADGSAPSPASAAAPASAIPVKVTSKMRARAEYERQLTEQGSDEDADELEVFEDDGDGAEDEDAPEAKTSMDKGKGRATEGIGKTEAAGAKKRRRPAVDPFAGYGDSQETKPTKSSKKTKQNPKVTQGDDVAMSDEATGGSNTPLSTPSSAKKDKSNTKAARKKAKKSA